MRDGNTSIYLIIPPDYLTEYRAVLRVMIGFAMRELRTSFKESKENSNYQDKPPILFILDEFPQLAYMRPIEEALLYLAGYGVRFWFFVQDVSQLQLHYKNSWQTFFSNTSTQCFFGVSDIATANLVSERAGMTTVQHNTYAYGPSMTSAYVSRFGTQPRNTVDSLADHNSWQPYSKTVADSSRLLITPDEVMRMYDDQQIVFMKGLKPIHCYRTNYYDFIDLNEHSKILPPKEINFS
jgi:type IV secretion system protein VirD4